MLKQLVHLAVVIMLMLLIPGWTLSENASRRDAVVTALEGTAKVFVKGKTAGRTLKKGDKLNRGHEVRVGERSRIEIRFPDGTVMWLSERSRFAMSEVVYDGKSGSKKLKVDLGVGKLWANVKKLITPDSSVEVRTGNAVAGVRGTVYRMNVEDDKSAVVKVYDGSVYVASPPREGTDKQAAQFSAPVPVLGPHEVPPPMHEVTMEEWHVIVKAMQELSISSEGAASKPQDFDPRSDADDWVKWNQERDKDLRL